MKIDMIPFKNILLFLMIVSLAFALKGCSDKASDPFAASGISASGYQIGISALYGGSSLKADGSSQATIRVEVWDTTTGGFVEDGTIVTLTATLGTLVSSSLTTTNGAKTTTYTAGSSAGIASVTATVENTSASATIVLSRF